MVSDQNVDSSIRRYRCQHFLWYRRNFRYQYRYRCIPNYNNVVKARMNQSGIIKVPRVSAYLRVKLTCSWVGGQGVFDKCRTCELWRPRLRWTPQHPSHIRTPLFTDAQRGSKGSQENQQINRKQTRDGHFWSYFISSNPQVWETSTRLIGGGA